MRKYLFSLILLLLFINLVAETAFNIEKFTDTKKYGWSTWEDRTNYRTDLYERQKLLQIYDIDAQTIPANILKSAIFPGWGQFNARHYTKGQVFLAIEIGMLGASYFFYDRSMDSYSKYKDAHQIDQMNAYYQDAQVPYQYALVFLTLAAVVWGYNVLDVIQSTEQYNSEVWQKTLKAYYQAPVKLTPEGVQIRF